MLAFRRPDEPPSFASHVREAQADIRAIIDRGEQLKSKTFKARWSAYKEHFATAQRDKCGYCEIHPGRDKRTRKSGSSHGVVDHYAPKIPYWWLAYAWDNYVYTCAECNQSYKRDQFPCASAPDEAAGPTLPAPPTGDAARSLPRRPLLLNPYEPGFRPGDHFLYGRLLGDLTHRSERGKTTIDVLGLDEDDLRELRKTRADIVYKLAESLAEALKASEQLGAVTPHVRLLDEYCHDANEFAGMSQTIVEQVTGISWRTLAQAL